MASCSCRVSLQPAAVAADPRGKRKNPSYPSRLTLAPPSLHQPVRRIWRPQPPRRWIRLARVMMQARSLNVLVAVLLVR
ncbi:hypothetical protein E2562_037769, partial [Oryza meyeriana var. granulata]